jgi:predicted nucleotidyltransferase
VLILPRGQLSTKWQALLSADHQATLTPSEAGDFIFSCIFFILRYDLIRVHFFMKRLSGDFFPLGSELTVGEIKSFVRALFRIVNRQYLFDAKIKDIEIIGSRVWGIPKSDSDLDVLIYYEGKAYPQVLKNLFAMSNNLLTLGNLEADITFVKRPIEKCFDSFNRFK